MITSGALARGQRLRPDEIADELGVSRIPVREGLIALDREGWVKFESSRGAFVAGIEGGAIADHYELRGLVFGLLGRRVTELATDGDVAWLVAVHRRMRTADDLETFSALNDQFIARLFTVANSPRLIAALIVSAEIIPERFFELVPAGRTIQQSGLAAFLRALKTRSLDDADRALAVLQRRQGEAVVATLAATGVVADGSPVRTRTGPYT